MGRDVWVCSYREGAVITDQSNANMDCVLLSNVTENTSLTELA